MQSKNKRLRVMAGPNGSGKSTVLKKVAEQFYTGPFVNADEIERLLKEKRVLDLPLIYGLDLANNEFDTFLAGMGNSWVEKARTESSSIGIKWNQGKLFIDAAPSPYDAALAADFIRYCLLNKNETFTFETVLSHSSKISFLEQSKKRGFKNYLYFICTIDPAINISRVKQRVQLGGHTVPEDRIIKRYKESLELLSQIIPLCYRVFFFDNSGETKDIEPIADIDEIGRLNLKGEITWWLQHYVIDRLY